MTTNGQAVQVQQQGTTIKDVLERMKPKLAEMMPKHLTPDRLIKVALNCIARVPLLQQCSAASLIQSCVTAAELGLEPGGALGHAYLVPFKGTCQLIIGYRGMVELARRSGHLAQIEAHVVHEGDEFKLEFGLTPILRHVPKLDLEIGAKPVLAYMLARLKDGSVHCEVMTWPEVQRIKDRSRSKDNGPWVTDPEEMAKKTVVRRGMKYMPLSAELAKALDVDDDDYVDSPLPSAALAAELTAPPLAKGNEKAKAALAARTQAPAVIDVQTGETEDEALARLQASEMGAAASPI